MSSIRLIDPGPFCSLDPPTDGCYESVGTSFAIGDRIFTVVFESHGVDNEEYRPFVFEQGFSCEKLTLVKFDNNFNVMPEDTYRRMPVEWRLSSHEMIRLSGLLVGSVERYIRERNPTAVVGIPNDAKLAGWYARLACRFKVNGRLIAMRESAYHTHRILVIHTV